MDKIVICRAGEILAHHTTDSCMSHYGQAVWVVEESDVEPGEVTWAQGDNELTLYALGVLGGWLMVRQPNGVLAGIIWTDGSYHGGNIVSRDTGEPVEGLTLEDLASGEYQVESAIAAEAFNVDSPLGCVLI